MTPVYASKLGLEVCCTDFGAQKIDTSTLKTFKIILGKFSSEKQAWKGLVILENIFIG